MHEEVKNIIFDRSLLHFKKYIILFFCISTTIKSFAQEKYIIYPKTLVIKKDSFALRWGNEEIDKYKFKRDTMNFNNGAIYGAYVKLYFNNDSIKIEYKNQLPYGQYTYVNFITNSKRKTIRLGFDAQHSIFGENYILKSKNKVQFDIPEVYELANVIWTLSPSGNKAIDINRESKYYKNMFSYFKPYSQLPIFKSLDFSDSVYLTSYFDFRENSFAYNFKNETIGSRSVKLLYNGPYYYVYGDKFADSSLFGKLKPMVEEFAKKSNFRTFFKNNISFYKQQIEREKQLLPIKQMWTWIEEEFPNTKFQSYRIIFSPLIGGSHSTQNYSTYTNNEIFSQSVMFICNTDRVDKNKELSQKKKEGLMSGVVFTEIDHNYVNRVTNKYRDLVDSIFSNKTIWVSKSSTSDFYGNPVSIFNEYMTWSVFCLYVLDKYEKVDAEFIINERESRMVDKRNFIKFKAFNETLIKIRHANKNLKIVELYPYILDWCKLQS
jgi:Domain of unknown function (DUF4932)